MECVVRQADISIRRTIPDDLDAIGTIYAHHVETGVATFELGAKPISRSGDTVVPVARYVAR